MTTGPAPYRAALVTGVGTFVYYATPDLISSRTARGWAKAAITTVAFAASLPDLRAAWATAREGRRLDGEPPPSELFRSLPTSGKAVLLGFVAVALTGTIGGVVLAERWAFRHGQVRAAAGRRLPHTAPALVYGAVAGGLWFLPPPSDASVPGRAIQRDAHR